MRRQRQLRRRIGCAVKVSGSSGGDHSRRGIERHRERTSSPMRSAAIRCKQVQAGASRCKQVQAGASRCKQVQAGTSRCKQRQSHGNHLLPDELLDDVLDGHHAEDDDVLGHVGVAAPAVLDDIGLQKESEGRRSQRASDGIGRNRTASFHLLRDERHVRSARLEAVEHVEDRVRGRHDHRPAQAQLLDERGRSKESDGRSTESEGRSKESEGRPKESDET